MKEIEQIQEIINGMKLKNIPLMKKTVESKKVKEMHVYTHASKVDDLRSDIFWGCDIHTYKPTYGDPTYWHYEKGVEEKIKDDCQYKVWYTWSDAADPCDSTTRYHVWYIEEIPKIKQELVKFLKETLKKLQ